MLTRLARYVPANGILFAALVIAASLITSDTPGRSATDAEIVGYYDPHPEGGTGNRDSEIASFFLIGLAVLAFLSFLGSLRGALARVEGEPARLTTAATAGAVAFISLAAAAHVVGTSPAFAAAFYDDFVVEPDSIRLVGALSYGFFVMSLFAATAMTSATAVIALWLGGVPRWLGWFGLLATLAGLLGFLVLPSLVVLAWIVAMSVWLLRPRVLPATAP